MYRQVTGNGHCTGEQAGENNKTANCLAADGVEGGRNWCALLLVGLLLYFGYFSWGQFKLMLELRRELSQVEQGIVAAEQHSQELTAEIEYLKSDFYIEKVARQELGLVKPGEIIFMPESSWDQGDRLH